ncbi:hypothetical protein ACFLT5_03765 [Chloroflexota bacterium]
MDFRIIDLYAFEDGSLTSTGFRNVYFTALDASGAPIDGIILQETNNQPAEQLVSGEKGPGKAEFTLWDKAYKFKIVGNVEGQTFSSEETHMISILPDFAVWDDLIRGGICPDEDTCRSMGKMHYSYILTYQRTW